MKQASKRYARFETCDMPESNAWSEARHAVEAARAIRRSAGARSNALQTNRRTIWVVAASEPTARPHRRYRTRCLALTRGRMTRTCRRCGWSESSQATRSARNRRRRVAMTAATPTTRRLHRTRREASSAHTVREAWRRLEQSGGHRSRVTIRGTAVESGALRLKDVAYEPLLPTDYDCRTQIDHRKRRPQRLNDRLSSSLRRSCAIRRALRMA